MKFSDMRRFILIDSLVLFLLLLAFYFDHRISVLVSLIRNSILDNFFMGITFVSSILIVFLFLTLLFVRENKRKWILPLWVTLVANVIVGFLLKVVVQRQRPYQLELVSVAQGLAENAHKVWDFSFPSFQAMMVFCAVPLLSKEFPKFKYVWVIFACLVAFSRVYLGVHFLSDVIAGALIGYMIGYFIMRNVEGK
ncbi:MAG: phosphatase PAP2 family protein [Nanoarchaeota archaeon]